MALPFSTIQDGLDVADGETIIVLQDGTYSGTGNINLEIYDSYTRIESSNGYSNTIMDCENSGFGIALNKGTFFLTGLAIQNCNGILRELDGLPLGNGTGAASIKNRTIGGGLWIENAYAKITNCKLDSNTAELGGGMYTFSTTVDLISSIVSNNHATGRGGGIYVRNGYLYLNHSTAVIDNDAENGAGMYNILSIFCFLFL